MAKATQNQKKAIFALFDEGLTVAQIMEREDVSVGYVTIMKFRKEWRESKNLPKYYRQGANSAA